VNETDNETAYVRLAKKKTWEKNCQKRCCVAPGPGIGGGPGKRRNCQKLKNQDGRQEEIIENRRGNQKTEERKKSKGDD